MSLRGDPHAQYEIRAYVDVMLDIVKEWVPFAYEAFMEHKVHGAYFSKSGLDVIKRMISGETVSQETSNMSEREWGELMVKLGK